MQNYSGLLACRFFLGVFEAGLFPGCAFITTAWYRRFEVQYRVALFYTAASLSGAFSGLLAFAIGKMEGIRGYSGWRCVVFTYRVPTKFSRIRVLISLMLSDGYLSWKAVQPVL